MSENNDIKEKLARIEIISELQKRYQKTKLRIELEKHIKDHKEKVKLQRKDPELKDDSVMKEPLIIKRDSFPRTYQKTNSTRNR